MSSETVTRDIVINASPETVYDVVSRPEHIAVWFSDEADLEPVPLARGSLTWRDKATGQASNVEVTVVTADRPHTFGFLWVSPERLSAGATDAVLVEFRITAEDGGTRLVVSESGMDTWDATARHAYVTDHTDGWGRFLQQLRSHAEGLVAQDSA